MQYARLYPEHAVALVLVEGSVSMPASVPRERRLSAAKQYGESLTAREAMIEAMFAANTTPKVRKRVLSMVLAVPSATPLAAMEAFMDSAIWKEHVFPQPALAAFAESLDAKDRESDLEYMKTRFPNLEYVKMAGTGHFVMLEKPAQFNALLKSLVDKLKY